MFIDRERVGLLQREKTEKIRTTLPFHWAQEKAKQEGNNPYPEEDIWARKTGRPCAGWWISLTSIVPHVPHADSVGN